MASVLAMVAVGTAGSGRADPYAAADKLSAAILLALLSIARVITKEVPGPCGNSSRTHTPCAGPSRRRVGGFRLLLLRIEHG